MFFKLLGASSILLLSSVSGVFIASKTVEAQGLQNSENRKSHANQILHITIQNEDTISGLYTVDEQEQITLPLIGKISIKGQSLTQIESLLTHHFKDGYLIDPIISVRQQTTPTTFTTTRAETKAEQTHKTTTPGIYILGGVKNPGRYDLPNDATHILNAIALAGGFTGNAKAKTFDIIRQNQKITFDKETYTPQSGDIIIVKERYFWAGNR